MKITVIGMGFEKDDLSLKAYGELKSAGDKKKIVVKTALIKPYLNVKDFEHITLDKLFSESADFDALNNEICRTLIELSVQSEVLYCVGGDGYSDSSVITLKGLLSDLEIIPGVAAAARALKVTPSLSYAVKSGYEVLQCVNFDTEQNLIITEIDNFELAATIKSRLSKYYPDFAPVIINGNKKQLFELDRLKKYSYETYMLVEGRSFLEKDIFNYCDLIKIIKALRAPDGCPWDREQTHESIRTNLLEEAYEVLDAMESGDGENFVEELGDLLLQPLFHAAIAEDNDAFDDTDIITSLCKKLIYRHPHVFGSVKAGNSGEALGSWEKQKRNEKDQKTLLDSLKSLPAGLPQLMRAVKVGKKTAKAGIGDTVDVDACIQSAAAALKMMARTEDISQRKKILGVCLYSLATLARVLEIDPELALKKDIDDKLNFVKEIEEYLANRNKNIFSAEQQDIDEAVARCVINRTTPLN